MSKDMHITRRGIRYRVEKIKSCHTSLGFDIFLFRNLSIDCKTAPFFVAVKNSAGDTVEFLRPINIKLACMYYVDFICCYA